jgi:hypothetical protein
MAGANRLVRVTGAADSDVRALADALNQLITDYDAHTHSGVTAGAGVTGAPSAATTSRPVASAIDGNKIVYIEG